MNRAARRVLIAGAAALLLAVASVTYADPDLWGNVRFGLDVLQVHHLTSIDPYSFTQDQPWVNHEWLSELPMGLAYFAGGSAGLALLKGVLVACAVALVWSALRGTEFGARVMVLAVFVIGTGRMTKTLRPQLWSLICFLILCRILAGDRVRARRWLPLLFAVWANLHGGWLVGFGVLGVWAGGQIWSSPQKGREWTVIVIASALATLCTPYGWTLWTFLWRTVGMTRAITEWQPLWTTPPVAWLSWSLCAVGLLWAARRADSQRLSRTAVLLMLAYASLRVERITPFFIGASALLLASWIRQRWPDKQGAAAVPHQVPVAAAVCAGAVALSVWIASSSLRCIRIEGPWMPDRESARFLDSANSGRLVTFFDWGHYALWHWAPRLRVSMDGRRETVFSDARLAQHDAIVSGRAEGLAALEEWRPEYVWLPAGSATTKRWLAAHDYRIEHETSRSFVAARGDLPRLTASPDERDKRACFPD